MAIPLAAAAIAGGASLAGSAFSAYMARKTSQDQMDFQERMSNTAHQREITDLQKAGLNPILSAKLGGSSTPPGAQAQVPDFGNSARTAIEGIQAVADLGVKAATVRDINAAADLKDTQRVDIANTQQSRIQQALQAAYASQQSGNLSSTQQRNTAFQIRALEAELERIRLENQHSALDLYRSRSESDFYKGFGGKMAPWIEHILKKVNLPSIGKKIILPPSGRR